MFPVASKVRPSYEENFARSMNESAFPQFWDGLVSAWMPMLGGFQNILTDVGPRANHVSLTNPGWFSAAPLGGVLPRVQYITAPGLNMTADGTFTRSSGLQGKSAMSIVYAMRDPGAITGQFYAISEQGSGNDPFFLLCQANERWRFHTHTSVTGSDDLNTDKISSTEYTNIVCTYDGTTKIVYLNGVAIATKAASGTIDTNKPGIFLGVYAQSTHAFFACMLYDRALSSIEVNMLYEDPLLPFVRKDTIWPTSGSSGIVNAKCNWGSWCRRWV